MCKISILYDGFLSPYFRKQLMDFQSDFGNLKDQDSEQIHGQELRYY